VKVEFADDVFPPAGPGGYRSLPRALRTPFIDEWNARPDEVKREAARLRTELLGAVQHGRGREYVPFTGQTAGMKREILPAGEIVRRIMAEAEAALQRVLSLVAVSTRANEP
jgi:enoyl-[acyl-carrier protein] reductase II